MNSTNDTELKTYDKEGWWLVCKECRPDITREIFESKWAAFVMMANLMGLWRKV